MTSGGTCFQCGEWVTCLPDLPAEFACAEVRRGRWDPATRRWSCFACVPEVASPAPTSVAEFEPDLEHQRRQLAVLRLRPSTRHEAISEKVRIALAAAKAERRASQPWRRW